MRILITGFFVFAVWSFFSMWLYVDILKPAARKQVVAEPVVEKPDSVADSLALLRASMPRDMLIFFDFDKAQIKEDPSSDTGITGFKNWLEKYPSSVLSITGHTDFIGTPEYNYRLGMERAEAVKNYLEKKGIPPGRMIIESKGGDHPAGPHYTSAGRAMNRRTVVTIKM